jgi:serine/threonine-protein kinase HipA
MHKCLYCCKILDGELDFHPQCSLEFFGTKETPRLPYNMDEMSELAKIVIERSVAVPGVQAKLSLSLVEAAKNDTDGRLTVVGVLGGNYILKPPSKDFPEMPQNEHLTMRIAKALGIQVVPSTLIRLKSGELAYLTKRIDRKDDGSKIHMLDMFQITEAFDKYKSSMEKVGKAIGNYSSNTLLDKLFFYELSLFSFLIGNNDMHLKNFSMIQTDLGWLLAPAYDLLNVVILNPHDTEELALTLEGRKSKFSRTHFEDFGKGLGLTPIQINRVFARLLKNKPKAMAWIDDSFLSEGMKTFYREVVKERYTRIYRLT